MNQSEKFPKIFYGWYILAIGVAGAFLAAGTSQLFMSIMLKPLTEDFGWSRTAATGAITTGTILAGLLSLPFGKLVDRYGPRFLTSAGALITAGVYFAIAKFIYLWQFYVVFVLGRIVATNTLAGIVPRTAAVNWFRRFRGRALGFISMATPLGSSLLAITAQLIMEHYGWRIVFIVFALAMVLLQVLPAALLLRKQPEDLGLVPDGRPARQTTSTFDVQAPTQKEFSWKLSEAIRTSALWLLVIASIVAPMVGAGVAFHLVAYLTDVGIDATIAVGAVSIFAFTGALSNVVWGFLSERFPERFLASAVMALTAASIAYLHSVRTPAGAFIFAVIYGLSCRGEGALFNIILAQYFGRSSYGTISGFVFPFHNLGLGFGPLISSVSFDLTGSYHAVFNIYIAIALITAFLLLLAKKPGPPVGKSSSRSL